MTDPSKQAGKDLYVYCVTTQGRLKFFTEPDRFGRNFWATKRTRAKVFESTSKARDAVMHARARTPQSEAEVVDMMERRVFNAIYRFTRALPDPTEV